MNKYGLCVLACAVALGTLTGSATAERYRTGPVVPSSARPLWVWLRYATRMNDPFIDGGSNYYVNATRRFPPVDAEPAHSYGMTNPQGPTAEWTVLPAKDGWWAVADRRHRLVYYGEHCCSFGRAVVARYDGGPPPSAIPERDLVASAPRGAPRIGAPVDEVLKALGKPKQRFHVRGSNRWAAYYAQPLWTQTDHELRQKEASCTDDLTAIFEDGRLVALQEWRGC